MKKLYLFLLSLLFCPVAYAGSSQDGRLLYDTYDITALSAMCDRLSENSDSDHKYIPIVGQ